MRTRAVLIVGAVLVGLLVPGVAQAKKHHGGTQFPSTVTIKGATGSGDVGGRVTSPDDRCVIERDVSLERNGHEVATATADGDGNWEATSSETLASGDTLVAKVSKIKLSKLRKKKDSCDGATSNSVTLHRLLITVTGNGRVDSSPSGIEDCRAGSGACSALFAATATVVATPDEGNDFDQYTGDCAGPNAHCQLVMNTDRATTAKFKTSSTPPPPPGPSCSIPPLPQQLVDALEPLLTALGLC